jgi:hypothetical protein
MKYKTQVFSLLLLIVWILVLAEPTQASDKNRETLVKKIISSFSLAEKNSNYWTQKSVLNFSLISPLEAVSPFITDPVQASAELKPRPKKTRAFWQLAALMSYSQARYWIKYSRFIEDWQYKLTWEDQKRRFFTTEALRFDSNAFYLNWTHAFAGMLYYEFARANNLSWLQASLFSIGGSLYWEYIVEWREIISINDNIMTAVGGIPLGESWFQMGRYLLNSTKPVSRLASWLNPFLKINGWLDRKKTLPPYQQSYNQSVQDVYLFLGYRHSPTSENTSPTGNLALSLHSRIITNSSYGITGRVDEKFTSPFYSQLDFDFMYHGRYREEMGAIAKIVPYGRFLQNLSPDRRGYSLFYGLGTAYFLYVKRPVTDYDAGKLPVNEPDKFHFELPRNFRDKLSAVHLVGPVLDITYFSHPWKLNLKVEAYPSFGMINALALNKYSINHDVQGMKTTVTYYGYHYALGPALESELGLDYKNLRLKGFVSYLYYRSIQGRDRFQSWITDDSVIRDSRWHTGLNLNYRVLGSDFSLVAALEWVKRWGKIHEVEDRNLEKRFYLGLKYNL